MESVLTTYSPANVEKPQPNVNKSNYFIVITRPPFKGRQCRSVKDKLLSLFIKGLLTTNAYKCLQKIQMSTRLTISKLLPGHHLKAVNVGVFRTNS